MAKQIDINSLANAIYQGKITPRNLPEVVYHLNAEKIVEGIYKGYGKALKDIAYDSPEFKMLNSLRENAYIFSGAKTFQETLQMTQAMTDGDKVLSFDDFKSKVEDLNVKFNENYLETEYNTAIASSQNASSWERFEQDAEQLPFLTYQTIGEACEICLPLDGITLPVGDEFWSKFYPPNHFNCFCICLNSDDDNNLTSKSVRDRELTRLGDLVSDTFQMNTGKLGETFSKDHPYFVVPKEYKDFAKDNFGLDIPPPEAKPPSSEIEAENDLKLTYGKSDLVPDNLKQLGLPDQIFILSDNGTANVTKGKSFYSPLTKEVTIGIKSQRAKMSPNIYAKKVVVHEYGHRTHFNEGWSVFDGIDKMPLEHKSAFLESEKLVTDLIKNNTRETLLSKFGGSGIYQRWKGAFPDLTTSDIFEHISAYTDTIEALTKGKYGAGHGKAYFTKNGGAYRPMEWFAHASENYWVGNPIFKGEFPELYEQMMTYYKKQVVDVKLKNFKK